MEAKDEPHKPILIIVNRHPAIMTKESHQSDNQKQNHHQKKHNHASFLFVFLWDEFVVVFV